ncbi:DNA polymerase delta subunit 3-like [Littorina saxatilis]|uniref:DNA polymerase delta subunit 3 n=1 Tax=Littorina saxatilis TaxID=31220 RepID=A0AAN9G0U3_9CAEN
MASDSLCLDNIEEFVHDENKIVTCKWLSLTLKIHINQAKRLLYTFLQQQRKKDKELNATYFLAGLSKGDNGEVEHRCQVLPEEDLDAAKSQLSSVTSCHVYSIQRANLKDSNVLYMTDYEGVKENIAECIKYSSIHCQKASQPRAAAVRGKPSPDKSRKGTSNTETQRENGSSADKPSSTPAQASHSSKGKKAEPKGSIASMFAQTSKKPDTDAGKKKDVSAKEAAKENKPVHKKGGVMDMFANAKPAVKSKPAEVEKEKPAAKVKPVPKETKAQVKKASKVQESKSKKKPRPSQDSDADEQPEKKRRRRIKNDLFDSSSEEEDMEIDVESPIPSPVREQTPEPESPPPAKKTPEKRGKEKSEAADDKQANGGKLRRRKRKLVPKTYLDEDGFMVTEKVWESDSTDASEKEEETKKKVAPQKKAEPAPAKKNSPQKKASPAKGKQASIMSFFKKK